MATTKTIFPIEEQAHEGQMELNHVWLLKRENIGLQGQLQKSLAKQSDRARGIFADMAQVKFGALVWIANSTEVRVIRWVDRLNDIFQILVWKHLILIKNFVVVP